MCVEGKGDRGDGDINMGTLVFGRDFMGGILNLGFLLDWFYWKKISCAGREIFLPFLEERLDIGYRFLIYVFESLDVGH